MQETTAARERAIALEALYWDVLDEIRPLRTLARPVGEPEDTEALEDFARAAVRANQRLAALVTGPAVPWAVDMEVNHAAAVVAAAAACAVLATEEHGEGTIPPDLSPGRGECASAIGFLMEQLLEDWKDPARAERWVEEPMSPGEEVDRG